tara:strand:- start:29 stop:655 length:627 start_codon:yes stop_codon:yes gene_type:complete
MDVKNFIGVYDNALSKDECKYIIDFFNSSKLCENYNEFVCRKNGSTGGRIDKNIKDSTDIAMTFNHSDHKVNQIIMKSLASNTRKYVKSNDELKLISSWGILDSYNIQKYEPNQGYYGLHCENYNMDTNKRVMVWMFYLNSVTDDGGTYFSNYDLTLNAVEGRLVIWPAYWTHFHKGVVSASQEKYIATGWYEKIETSTVIRKVKKKL